MIVILYKINEIYIKNIRTYFKNLVSLNLYKNLFRLTKKYPGTYTRVFTVFVWELKKLQNEI